MRFRFDSNFDEETPGRSSFARPEFPVREAGKELRRYVARAQRGERQAADGFRGRFEPQVRRAVRRVLASGSPDASRLGRRVLEELDRVLQSHPDARFDPERVEELVTARICRAMTSRPARLSQEAIKETVRY